jgi:putative membrane protein
VTSPSSAEPPLGAYPESADADLAGWHRLHPLTPVVRAGTRLLSLIVVLAAISLLNQGQDKGQLVGDLLVIAVALSGGFVSWLVTRWQVADGVLRIETGLIRRASRRFPLTQIQAIDVVQTGLARVLGLAELQLRVAGSDTSRGGRLACLRLADAERLRRELLAFSVPVVGTPAVGTPVVGTPVVGTPVVGTPVVDASTARPPGVDPAFRDPADARAESGTAPVPERALFRVQPGRLAVAIVLSRAGAVAAAVIIIVAVVIGVTGSTAAIASFFPAALGLAAVVWRQFNSEYGTRIAAGPDGLRLRSGLIQTTAETIRPGRVQGVRLVEPLIWRAFGWCRLEVDVAGPKERRENRSEGQRLRAVIPVGTRAEAALMLAELLSSRPEPVSRPPRQVRLKAPLQYRFLGWGGDDRYVVASRGRVCRKTTWVALEKVQSFRWVQGPVQRRLGLASVLLDVAGRRVRADVDDRGAAEATDLLARLPGLARTARARFG